MIYSLLTIKACITPGNHPIIVRIMLKSKAVPTPCFRNTANGGKKMFNKIVSNDIMIGLD